MKKNVSFIILKSIVINHSIKGEEDSFLKDGQLLPDNLVSACVKVGMPIVLRKQSGYDHSYFFIASFLQDHFAHHAKFLK
jgi:S-formylglutathione hydrolase